MLLRTRARSSGGDPYEPSCNQDEGALAVQRSGAADPSDTFESRDKQDG